MPNVTRPNLAASPSSKSTVGHPSPTAETALATAPRELPPWLLTPWFLGLLLLLIICLAYSNSLNGQFLFDDHADILANKSLQHLWPLWDVLGANREGGWTMHARPLVTLSFALNRTLGGPGPFSFHLTNLCIHLAAALTLFGAIQRTLNVPRLRARYGRNSAVLAFTIALLWGLHPLQTESVSYITQRYEAMMGLFSFSTFYAVSRLAESSRPSGWILLATVSCLFALGSKEVAAALPILVLLYDRAFLAGSFRAALWERKGLYFGLLFAWGCFGLVQIQVPDRGWAGSTHHLSWWRYAMSQPGVILHYLRLTFWPDPLCLDYGWLPAQRWHQVLPGAISIGGLAAISGWALFRKPGLGFIALSFFAILAPTSSIVPINDLAVEHRMYLPLASVVILVVLGLYELHQTQPRVQKVTSLRALRVPMLLILVAIPTALGIRTYLRNEDYKNPLIMWKDSVATSPDNPRGRRSYAFHLAENGFDEEAAQQYAITLKQAPSSPLANSGYGILLVRLGRYAEAIGYLQKALALQPSDPSHQVNLGAALLENQSITTAIACFNKAIVMDPKKAEAYNGLGLAYQRKGDLKTAETNFKQALFLKPDNANFRFNYGTMLLQVNNKQLAFQEFHYALQVDFKGADSLSRLGWILYQGKEYSEAVRLFREGLRIEPDHVKTHVFLAWVLATCPDSTIRNGTEAVRLVESAMQIDRSRSPGLLNYLAVAQAEAGQFAAAEKTLLEARAKSTTRDDPWLADLELRLKLFEQRKPFRDSPSLFPTPPPKTSSTP